MVSDGFHGVLRARGPVPARRGPPGAKCLVEPDDAHQDGRRAPAPVVRGGVRGGRVGRALTGAGPGSRCHRCCHLCLQVLVRETSRLPTRRHQVRTGCERPGRVGYHGPQSAPEPVTDDGVAHPFPHRVRHLGNAGAVELDERHRDVAPSARRPWRRRASNVVRSLIRQPTGAPPPSRGEAVATFDPACPEDRPPGTGGHPVPKPVVLGPFPGVGLVSPLHSLVLCAQGRLRRGCVCRGAVRTGARPEICPPMLGTPTRAHQAALPRAEGAGEAQFSTKFTTPGPPRQARWGRSSPTATRVASPLAAPDPPVYRSSLRRHPDEVTPSTGSSFPGADQTNRQQVDGRQLPGSIHRCGSACGQIWRRDGGGPGE